MMKIIDWIHQAPIEQIADWIYNVAFEPCDFCNNYDSERCKGRSTRSCIEGIKDRLMEEHDDDYFS